MSDLIELEIERGLRGMRDQMGIPQPEAEVIEFPRPARVVPAQQTVHGRLADALLSLERMADLMGCIASNATNPTVTRERIASMLRTAEQAARDAVEKLES